MLKIAESTVLKKIKTTTKSPIESGVLKLKIISDGELVTPPVYQCSTLKHQHVTVVVTAAMCTAVFQVCYSPVTQFPTLQQFYVAAHSN